MLKSSLITIHLNITIIFAVLLVMPTSAYSQFIDLPTTKIVVALPVVNYTKTLPAKQISESSQLEAVNEAESLTTGFAADASVFFNESLALALQFEMNLHQETQSLLFLGGGAGITWYLLGGANMEHLDPYMQTVTYPKYSVYSTFGLASRQYDFSAVRAKEDAATTQQTTNGQSTPKTADPRDPASGSFFGLMVGLGGEYPVGYNLLPGLRVQYITSFGGENQPKFTLMEIWLSVGFIL